MGYCVNNYNLTQLTSNSWLHSMAIADSAWYLVVIITLWWWVVLFTLVNKQLEGTIEIYGGNEGVLVRGQAQNFVG